MEKIFNEMIEDKNKLYVKNKILKNATFIKNLTGGIFAMFSFVIDTPKILIFLDSSQVCKNEYLACKRIIESLNCKVLVDNYIGKNVEKFCKAVHCFEYDLGIIFSQKKDKTLLEFISASGKELSNTKMSILKKYLNF